MKRKKQTQFLCFAIVFLSTITISSQEEIARFKNSIKKNSTAIKDVIPIVNAENNEISMFIADAKNVYGYKLDENFKVIDSLTSERKKRKYNLIVGNSISGNNHTIFLSDQTQKNFLLIDFSFDTRTTSSKEFTVEQNDEEILQTASINNKFYLLTIRPVWGILYIYSFENNTVKRNEVFLNKIPFLDEKGFKKSAAYLLKNNNTAVHKIDATLPNSMELVSDKSKMYIRDNSILFSFDQNSSVTQTLSINLDDYTTDVRSFKKPMEDLKINKKNSNSFINGDHIFLFASNKKKLVLNILDYNTQNLVRSFEITKDKPIAFKNSPIIIDGGTFAKYRELNKSKQFLRAMNLDKVGIAVRKRGNDYQLTIGGTKEVANAGAAIMGSFGASGLPIGSIGNFSIFFNPTAFAYKNSANIRSTYIECILDENFKHKAGDIQENVFDKIRKNDMAVVFDDNENAETVFKYKGFFISGRYYPRKKAYALTKFTD